MAGTQLKNFAHCLKIGQLALLTFWSVSLCAKNLESKKIVSRMPASSTVPDEEVIVPPAVEAAWVELWLKEDDEGIMKRTRAELENTVRREEYAKLWNLESTNLFIAPKKNARNKMIAQNMLKYVDKRFSGEIKNAEEGSTFHKVGQVEKAIRPQSTLQLAKNYAIKFKARPLQGRGIMEVRNPYIELNTVLTLNGRVKTMASKEFKTIGFKTGAEYQLRGATWIVFMEQAISENLKAKISSTNRSPAFAHRVDDQKVEMIAGFPFEF